MTASSPDHAPSRELHSEDRVLLDLLRHLGGETDSHALYQAVDQSLARVVRYDRIAIGRLNTITRRITTEYERGISIGLPERYESLPTDRRSLTYTVVNDGAAIVHSVPIDFNLFRGDAIRRRYGLRQVLVTPVVIRGATAGVLKLYSEDANRFTLETADTAERFARALGLALTATEGRVDAHAPTERLMAEVSLGIARAPGPARLLDELYRGIVDGTGAAVLHFDRQRDGRYIFADARNCGGVCASGTSADDIGEELAQRLTSLPRMAPNNGDAVEFSDRASSIPALHLGPLGDLFNTTAVIVVPMRADDETTGVIIAAWPESTSSEDLERHAGTVQRLVELAVPALQRLRRIDHLEQRLSESETIRRLTESIARTPRFRDALDIICRTSLLITGLDVVVAGETTTDHLIWHAASGARDMSFIGQRVAIPNHILTRVLQSSDQVVLEDVRNTPELPPQIIPLHTREGLRSTVVVPIYVHARLRGLFMLSSRRTRRFSDDEIEMIQALSGTMATAIAASDAHVADSEDA